MNEEAFIISIKRDPELVWMMANNKALMAHAKRVAPYLNMETVARYRREYRHQKTPPNGSGTTKS